MVSRRSVLQFGSLAIAGLAGCQSLNVENERTRSPVSRTPSRTTTRRPDPPTGTRTGDCPPTEAPSGGASLAIRNRLDRARTGTVSVGLAGGRVSFEESFELAAGEDVLNRDVVTEAGDHEIELSIDGEDRERWTISLPDENARPLGAYTVGIVIDTETDLRVLHADPAPTPPGC